MKVPQPLAALGRAVSWHRRGLAALLAAAAVLLLYSTLRPGPGDEVTVVVAARPIASGQVIDQASLRVASVPRQWRPGGALAQAEDAVGRVATAGLTDNTILTDADVLAPRDAPDGTVIVPVRVPDAAVAALLIPGDRVDLFDRGSGFGQQSEGTGSRLARGAVVVTIAREAEGALGAGDSGALALLRMPDAVGERVARTDPGQITLVLR